jgi:hypothetical protein
VIAWALTLVNQRETNWEQLWGPVSVTVSEGLLGSCSEIVLVLESAHLQVTGLGSLSVLGRGTVSAPSSVHWLVPLLELVLVMRWVMMWVLRSATDLVTLLAAV